MQVRRSYGIPWRHVAMGTSCLLHDHVREDLGLLLLLSAKATSAEEPLDQGGVQIGEETPEGGVVVDEPVSADQVRELVQDDVGLMERRGSRFEPDVVGNLSGHA